MLTHHPFPLGTISVSPNPPYLPSLGLIFHYCSSITLAGKFLLYGLKTVIKHLLPYRGLSIKPL